MFRIFISYNNENREIVKTLADDVAALGHQVWLDTGAHRRAGLVGPDTCGNPAVSRISCLRCPPRRWIRIHASWNMSARPA